MKRIFLMILFSAPFFATAQNAVWIEIQSGRAIPSSNRNILLTPLNVVASSGVLATRERLRAATGPSGGVWVSNMLSGTWQVDVLGPPYSSTARWLFYVDPTNSIQWAGSNTVASSASTWPPDQVAWSASASDLRYAKIGEGGGGGTVIEYSSNAITNNDTRSITLAGPLALDNEAVFNGTNYFGDFKMYYGGDGSLVFLDDARDGVVSIYDGKITATGGIESTGGAGEISLKDLGGTETVRIEGSNGLVLASAFIGDGSGLTNITGVGVSPSALTNNDTRPITLSGPLTVSGGVVAPGLSGFSVVVTNFAFSNSTPIAVWNTTIPSNNTALIKWWGSIGSSTNAGTVDSSYGFIRGTGNASAGTNYSFKSGTTNTSIYMGASGSNAVIYAAGVSGEVSGLSLNGFMLTQTNAFQGVVVNQNTNNMVVWYKFNEGSGTSVADSSGNGLTMTLTNAGMWAGGSLSNNNNNFMATTPTLSFNTNIVTVMFWMNFIAYPTTFGSWLTPVGGNAANTFSSYFNTTLLVGQEFGSTGYRAEGWQYTTGIIPLNTWTHIAFVLDASTTSGDVMLFMNGTERTAGTVESNAKTGTSNFSDKAMTLLSDGTYPTKIKISDLRIYRGKRTNLIAGAVSDAIHP